MNEPQEAGKDPSAPAPLGKKSCPRGWAFQLTAVALTVVSALAGTGLARWLREPPRQAALPLGPKTEGQPAAPVLFRGWAKPDLALVLSAQMHGYLLPCGCSRPQVGGLERRYNFLEQLKVRKWPTLAVDLGDLPQKYGPAGLPNVQGLIKYRYALQALKRMDYPAIGLGEFEAAQGRLLNVVAEFALNEPKPRMLIANLDDKDKIFADMIKSYEVRKPAGSDLKVGVTALVGPAVQEKIKDPDVKFLPAGKALDGVLKDFDQQKVNFRILLYHGSAKEPLKGFPQAQPPAIALAKAYPQFNVILCLSEEDEPSSNPILVPHAGKERKTMVVTVGHKSKYVGVVGIIRTGKADPAFDLRYQLVELSEAFLTPAGKEEGHPILDLMEDYTRELEKGSYLSLYGQSKHPMQVAMADVVPTYKGSEACKKCHDSAYAVWKNTPHSHAYKTLVDAKKPGRRQFDPECVVCHTVGFCYFSGFMDADKTPKLRDVGCESCHGPASEHVKNPNNAFWHEQMNPWKAPEKESEVEKSRRILRIDQFCQKCHDIDNDVTWTHGGFNKKWPKIAHPTPKE